jgi:hypothetical protein
MCLRATSTVDIWILPRVVACNAMRCIASRRKSSGACRVLTTTTTPWTTHACMMHRTRWSGQSHGRTCARPVPCACTLAREHPHPPGTCTCMSALRATNDTTTAHGFASDRCYDWALLAASAQQRSISRVLISRPSLGRPRNFTKFFRFLVTSNLWTDA